MGRNKLYAILGAACAAGYFWLFFSMYHQAGPDPGFRVCMFKRMTAIPCPSCGSTRALLLLSRGDLCGSVLMNPFGLVLAAILLAFPLWIFYDLAANKQTLLNFYTKAEETARIRWIAGLLILLVLANWIWNIQKHL